MSKKGYKKGVASRQQVVDSAISALAKRGFAGTSVNDIAAEAGLSKGAVHYHFKSKDDLITQVLITCCEKVSEQVIDAWHQEGPPAERIRRALREMWLVRKSGGPEVRVIADLMAQGIHNQALKAPLAAMFQAAREQIVDQFVGTLVSLGLRPKIPAHIPPRLLLATFDGLALHHFFSPIPPEDEEEVLKALEMIAFSLFEM